MSRRRLTALAALPLAAAALAAAPAQAKQIQRVTACGADGCVDVTKRAATEALLEVGAAAGGATANGPGFVRLFVTVGEGDGAHERIAQLYVPARNVAASHLDGGAGWQWWTPDATATAALRRAVGGVRPLPASRLPRAAVRTALPAPAPRRPAVSQAGAGGGGMPAWGWALGAVLAMVAVVCGRAALRSHRR